MGISGAMGCALALVLWAAFTWIVCDGNEFQIFKPGRHICVKERFVTVPVQRKKTYCRPVYKRTDKPCGSDGRYCPSFRVVYQLAYRETFHVETSRQVMHTCCSGWSRNSRKETACMQAVCEEDCRNGGACVSPNKCQCPSGWTGKYCETDIDECVTRTDRCQQKCENNMGGYTCSCQDGFTLNDDKKSCALCLSCLREYKQMQSDYRKLKQRVIHLEEEKVKMEKNFSKLSRSYKNRNSKQHQSRSQATKPPVVSTTDRSARQCEEFQERVLSLSAQMSMFEEKLEMCTCVNQNDPPSIHFDKGNYFLPPR